LWSYFQYLLKGGNHKTGFFSEKQIVPNTKGRILPFPLISVFLTKRQNSAKILSKIFLLVSGTICLPKNGRIYAFLFSAFIPLSVFQQTLHILQHR
jgi:hypothetical protein